MKIRVIALLIFMAVLSLLLCGCSDKTVVSVEGSTSMELIIGILGEVYEEQKGIRISYNPTGSSAGIMAVNDGRCDIGLSSRELKHSETGLKTTLIAYDAIAVVVNKTNSISDMTIEQLNKIYTGEINNWKELGGLNMQIVLIGREANSGTRDGFESVTDTVNKCKYTREVTSSGDVMQTVQSNPNAIGYTSLASVSDDVTVINVNGIKPTVQSVQDGDYALKRSYYFVTRESEEPSQNTREFIEFALSPQSLKYIIKSGAIPALR